MADFWHPLEPMFSITKLNNPTEIDHTVALPKTSISVIGSWLDE